VDEVINAISPDLKAKLPPIKQPRELIGKIGADFVSKFDFSADCEIAAGSGDNMMGAIGTGNFKEGVVTVSLGTSGTAYTFMTQPYVDPKGEIAAFCDATGYWMPLLCISNLANGYEAILRQYSLTHEQFESELLNTPVGNNGKLMCPWFDGERTPDLPEATPVYFGFELDEFTKPNLCRAVMEGHIMNLYEGFLKLPVKASEIRLTGGISKSKAWRQAIADIFECGVVPVLGEGAALGAAIHAAWASEKDKSIVDIASPFILLDQSQRVSPISVNVDKYRQFKQIYLAVSARIRGIKTDNPFKLLKNMRE
jgi:xylulokinase